MLTIIQRRCHYDHSNLMERDPRWLSCELWTHAQICRNDVCIDSSKIEYRLTARSFFMRQLKHLDDLLSVKSTRWVLAQRSTVMRSGFAYRRMSAAVWRRPELSKLEPPTLVPIRCWKVLPLSGTTPTSSNPALAARWKVCSSGSAATMGVTHA